MKKRKASSRFNWRIVGFVVAALGITAGLYSIRLASLEPALSPAEHANVQPINLLTMLHDPLNLVWNVLFWSVHLIHIGHVVFFARVPSVILGITAVGLMLYILHRWYGPRSMVFGFFLFASSAWILHASRFAGPDISLITALLAVLAAHIYLNDHEDSKLALYAWLLVNVGAILTPGLVWFVVASAGLQWRALAHAWFNLGPLWKRLLFVLVIVIGLGALAYGAATGAHPLLNWLGLSSTVPAWRTIPRLLLAAVESFVWRGPDWPELWLARLPLFDIFTIAAFLAGIVFYARHWSASRTRLLGCYLVIGIILAGIGPVANLGLVVPVVYLVAVAGIALILHRWLAVFPRNPLARGFGIGLVGCLVGLACLYNCLQYFVAWPHNPDTKAVYTRVVTR